MAIPTIVPNEVAQADVMRQFDEYKAKQQPISKQMSAFQDYLATNRPSFAQQPSRLQMGTASDIETGNPIGQSSPDGSQPYPQMQTYGEPSPPFPDGGQPYPQSQTYGGSPPNAPVSLAGASTPAVGSPLPATLGMGSTGGISAPSAQAFSGNDITPNQFGSDQGLTTAEAYSACGPAAAVAFARAAGRNPTLREATNLAVSVGWNSNAGMAGAGSEKALMGKLGVNAELDPNSDWNRIQQTAQSGKPVAISTAAHYFVANDYNPTTQQYYVGASGRALRGGSDWMTRAQIEQRGAANGALYMGENQTASGESITAPQSVDQAPPPADPVPSQSYGGTLLPKAFTPTTPPTQVSESPVAPMGLTDSSTVADAGVSQPASVPVPQPSPVAPVPAALPPSQRIENPWLRSLGLGVADAGAGIGVAEQYVGAQLNKAIPWLGAGNIEAQGKEMSAQALAVQAGNQEETPVAVDTSSPQAIAQSLVNPEFLRQTLVRSVPNLVLQGGVMAVGATLAVAVAGIAGPEVAAISAVPMIGGAVLAGLQGSLQEAGAAYVDLKAQGKSEQEATDAARNLFWVNTALTPLYAADFNMLFKAMPAPVKARVTGEIIRSMGKDLGMGAAKVLGSTGIGSTTTVMQDAFRRQALGQPVEWDPEMQQGAIIGGVMNAGMAVPHLGATVVKGVGELGHAAGPVERALLKGGVLGSEQGSLKIPGREPSPEQSNQVNKARTVAQVEGIVRPGDAIEDVNLHRVTQDEYTSLLQDRLDYAKRIGNAAKINDARTALDNGTAIQRAAVESYLQTGKKVPANVLADYNARPDDGYGASAALLTKLRNAQWENEKLLASGGSPVPLKITPVQFDNTPWLRALLDQRRRGSFTPNTQEEATAAEALRVQRFKGTSQSDGHTNLLRSGMGLADNLLSANKWLRAKVEQNATLREAQEQERLYGKLGGIENAPAPLDTGANGNGRGGEIPPKTPPPAAPPPDDSGQLPLDTGNGTGETTDTLTSTQTSTPPTDAPPPPAIDTPSAVYGKTPERGVGPGTMDNPVDIRYKVVPLDTLVASHDTSFQKNPLYDQGLQTRERDNPVEQDLVKRNALELKSGHLLDSPSDVSVPAESRPIQRLEVGSPLVGPDNMVESGNGRIMAMRLALRDHPERMVEYQRDLRANLASYGINAEDANIRNMKDPVLVRERTTPMNPEQRRLFSESINSSTSATFGEGNQARNDMRHLSPAVMGLFKFTPDTRTPIEVQLRAPGNTDFAGRFFDSIRPRSNILSNADATFFTKNKAGNLIPTLAAYRRLRAAMLALTYSDETHPLTKPFLNAVLEGTEDSPVQALQTALIAAVPDLQNAISERGRFAGQELDSGQKYPDYRIGPAVAEAVGTIAGMRATGSTMDVKTLLASETLPGMEQISPEQRKLVQILNDLSTGASGKGTNSAARVRTFLVDYANLVKGQPDPNQHSLFGEQVDPASRDSLIDQAAKTSKERTIRDAVVQGEQAKEGQSQGEQATEETPPYEPPVNLYNEDGTQRIGLMKDKFAYLNDSADPGTIKEALAAGKKLDQSTAFEGQTPAEQATIARLIEARPGVWSHVLLAMKEGNTTDAVLIDRAAAMGMTAKEFLALPTSHQFSATELLSASVAASTMLDDLKVEVDMLDRIHNNDATKYTVDEWTALSLHASKAAEMYALARSGESQAGTNLHAVKIMLDDTKRGDFVIQNSTAAKLAGRKNTADAARRTRDILLKSLKERRVELTPEELARLNQMGDGSTPRTRGPRLTEEQLQTQHDAKMKLLDDSKAAWDVEHVRRKQKNLDLQDEIGKRVQQRKDRAGTEKLQRQLKNDQDKLARDASAEVEKQRKGEEDRIAWKNKTDATPKTTGTERKLESGTVPSDTPSDVADVINKNISPPPIRDSEAQHAKHASYEGNIRRWQAKLIESLFGDSIKMESAPDPARDTDAARLLRLDDYHRRLTEAVEYRLGKEFVPPEMPQGSSSGHRFSTRAEYDAWVKEYRQWRTDIETKHIGDLMGRTKEARDARDAMYAGKDLTETERQYIADHQPPGSLERMGKGPTPSFIDDVRRWQIGLMTQKFEDRPELRIEPPVKGETPAEAVARKDRWIERVKQFAVKNLGPEYEPPEFKGNVSEWRAQLDEWQTNMRGKGMQELLDERTRRNALPLDKQEQARLRDLANEETRLAREIAQLMDEQHAELYRESQVEKEALRDAPRWSQPGARSGPEWDANIEEQQRLLEGWNVPADLLQQGYQKVAELQKVLNRLEADVKKKGEDKAGTRERPVPKTTPQTLAREAINKAKSDLAKAQSDADALIRKRIVDLEFEQNRSGVDVAAIHAEIASLQKIQDQERYHQDTLGRLAEKSRFTQQRKMSQMLEGLFGKSPTKETQMAMLRLIRGDPEHPEYRNVQIASFLSGLSNVTWYDRVNLWRYNSMLSTISLQVRNVVGNTIRLAAIPMTRAGAVGVDVVRVKTANAFYRARGGDFVPKERTVYLAEVKAMWKGMQEGHILGYKDAMTFFDTGINPRHAGKVQAEIGSVKGIDMGLKIEDSTIGKYLDRTLGNSALVKTVLQKDFANSGIRQFLDKKMGYERPTGIANVSDAAPVSGAINRWTTSSTTMLAMADLYFRNVAEMAEIYSLATRHALNDFNTYGLDRLESMNDFSIREQRATKSEQARDALTQKAQPGVPLPTGEERFNAAQAAGRIADDREARLGELADPNRPDSIQYGMVDPQGMDPQRRKETAISDRIYYITHTLAEFPEIIDVAQRKGAEAVFQEVRERDVAMRAVNQLRAGHGVLGVLVNLAVPFVHTSYNVTVQAAEMSPLGLIRVLKLIGENYQSSRANTPANNLVQGALAQERMARPGSRYGKPFVPEDTRAGDYAMAPKGSSGGRENVGEPNTVELQEAISRTIIGTMTSALIYNLAMGGMITGPRPTDPAEASTLPPGWMPFSFRYIDENGKGMYFDSSQIDMLNIPFSLAAVLADNTQRGIVNPDESITRLLSECAKFAAQQTWWQGLAELFNAPLDTSKVNTLLNGMAQQFVPAGAIQRQMMGGIGGQPQRDLGNTLGSSQVKAMLASSPLTAGLVPEKVDALGNPSYPVDAGPLRGIIPWRVSSHADDPILAQLRDHGIELPKAGNVIPQGQMNIALLPTEQKEYDKILGDLINQIVGQAIQSSAYKNASRGGQSRFIMNAISIAKQRAERQVKLSIVHRYPNGQSSIAGRVMAYRMAMAAKGRTDAPVGSSLAA